ncbi:iron complex transport system permease protein [Tamilnaduibacter salinus]|uniref:Iron complex transport system permease protein n=1 Tax=Tamilnaduibacter salinus TaxID=1484056 RepID=A0A2U1CY39_9GAMM|nr:Fe(3+)-hydroxamate ABC transporter permease FhuB [Tamilnaduibacter salinus]PVY77036.1 iron complex transport system permease protein [Tamilnaduibacter salinus]
MSESVVSSTGRVARRGRRRWLTSGRLCGVLGLLVLALVVTGQSPELSGWENVRSLWQAGEAPASQLMHYAWWPRFFVAVLAGAGLAVAGVLMQQVLRNPLAAPTTLGVATGANVAMALALVFTPALMAWGREWVAMAGGAVAMGVVFLLAWRRQLAPTVVVLAGLVVNLYLSAVATVLLILNPETLTGLLVWGAGSLTQNSWDGVAFLWPRLLVGGAVAVALLRPLAILELDDANARSLGVSLRNLRLGSLGVAVFLTAVVVSAVGVVGFIGLAAPAIVRILGARQVGHRLGWGALLGALLLLLTDLLVQRVPGIFATLLPTGATTAALGAPLLLWLIPRLKLGSDKPHEHAMPGGRHTRPGQLLTMLALLCGVSLLLALMVGQGMSGWHVLPSAEVLEWRLPRTLAAAGAGIMLAIAGTILQRITGNPMASPEVLGISAGTAMGFIGAIYLLPGTTSTLTMIGIGTVSALATVGLVVLLNRRSGFVPERVLLTGVAITALFEAVKTFVLSGGDPRGREVIAWMSGSTYFVELWTAVAAIILAVILLIVTRPFARWLDMLPLGAPTAGSLGVAVSRGRLVLLGLAALMTAAATLIIGPLSFVGLLAPHLARMIGLHHARIHMLGAALCGAALMMLADWAGRQVLFPEEIPAGIMASLVGGAYFMWGLRRL